MAHGTVTDNIHVWDGNAEVDSAHSDSLHVYEHRVSTARESWRGGSEGERPNLKMQRQADWLIFLGDGFGGGLPVAWDCYYIPVREIARASFRSTCLSSQGIQ